MTSTFLIADAVDLAIALAAIRIVRQPNDRERTFSYNLLEILAATFNADL